MYLRHNSGDGAPKVQGDSLELIWMQINEMPLTVRGILDCLGRYYSGENFWGVGFELVWQLSGKI